MKQKNISMIGAGKMAAILSRYFAIAGHSVHIGTRDTEKAAQLALEIGCGVHSGSIEKAVQQGDIVFLAVPYLQIPQALEHAGSLSGKIVVDISNPLNADYSGLLPGMDISGAEELAKVLPDAKVVKAFNCIYATVLEGGPEYGSGSGSGDEEGGGQPDGNMRAQVFYAGDDEQAKQVVAELIEDTGFVPINTGGLMSARYQENLTALILQVDKHLKEPMQIASAMLMRESL